MYKRKIFYFIFSKPHSNNTWKNLLKPTHLPIKNTHVRHKRTLTTSSTHTRTEKGQLSKGEGDKGLIPARRQRRPADNRKTIRSALATRGAGIKTELMRIKSGSCPG